MKSHDCEWKCHTPNLLSEILTNPGTEDLLRPMQIFARLLDKVATRASELNDPQLNHLMCRLTLYEVANPEAEGFDAAAVEEVAAAAVMAAL
jgi:hypothetical protein